MKKLKNAFFACVFFFPIFYPLQQANAAPLYSFTSHTFTPCGATGKNGPTLSNCQSAYSTAWSSNSSYFAVTNGIQSWTAPVTGQYQITAAGAVGAGGLSTKGLGAVIRATVRLNQGTSYKILVGQAGINGNAALPGTSGGGGGGTFFTDNSNTPILIAGGGGGSHNSTFNFASLANGQTTTSGSASSDSQGAAGTSGNGGGGASSGYGAGGGGLTGNGSAATYCSAAGYSFTNGGTGGTSCSTYLADGGFGGGGGTHGYSGGGAGGGGYSGGGGSGGGGANAGGGGSFIIAGATNIATSNGSYAGSSAGITNLNLYNGTANSSSFAAGYLTIQFLPDPVSVQVTPVSSFYAGTYRQTTQLQATLSASGGVVTFYERGKIISNCARIYTSTSSATCNWKPSTRGNVAVTAKVTPDNGAAGSFSQIVYFKINNRAGNR